MQDRVNTTRQNLFFEHLSLGVGVGFPVPKDWLPITSFPLLIIVGMTGVGKSTIAKALAKEGLDFTLLPNRRVLTERVIIAPMLKMQEKLIQPHCRIKRLTYTRLYREYFPGGMGHILASLHINPQQVNSMLVFDSLRGENEIRYAAKALKNAKFVMLTAPNTVRLERLIKRHDSFDRIANQELDERMQIIPEVLSNFASLGVPEASAYFTPKEEQQILELISKQVITSLELREKLKIFVEESQNYDSVLTKQILEAMDTSDRSLIIDTIVSPQESAKAIISQLYKSANIKTNK
ncbi:MAG: AAA family ATPase [Nostoc sp. DedQUE08]|uniref:AAA family ATPase n=1 Tax=unclassified Nostoc TaxID=2593658 RepID=UPI002AD46D9B|nr:MULTISPECIES: AAA family ATPase [unclassified Nostoc]MDZ8069646.1 AAA family ATPase [Nostoc sp. DedQUE08]MDZ8095862.1 AAA family ATPase [Nostoc sp. DedQUE05]MDZ8138290.1 AAA family ATPase [Nostoc sp. DedQUE04]